MEKRKLAGRGACCFLVASILTCRALAIGTSAASAVLIEQNSGRSGRPLVIASEEKNENLYVKDYGELEAPKGSVSNDFAEMLEMQESMLSQKDEGRKSDYASYLNDTIGMMGVQNRLRDQLNGAGFVPFS